MPFSDAGLSVPRYPDILKNLEDSEKVYIDSGINTSDDTLLGQLNKVQADAISAIYEYLEYGYNQKRLQSATGRGLDELGVMKGVVRKQPTAATAEVLMKGGHNSTIPANYSMQDPRTGIIWKTQEVTIFDKNACHQVEIRVIHLPEAGIQWFGAYTVVVNGITFTHTPPSSPPYEDSAIIANALKTLINGYGSPDFSAVTEGNTLFIKSNNLSSPISVPSVPIGYKMPYFRVYTHTFCKSQEVGANAYATAGSFNILNTLPEWYSAVPDLNTAINGTGLESDADFRLRILNTAATGKGTTQSLISKLRSLDNVSLALVEENLTNAPVLSGGVTVPAYGIQCVVDGGAPLDIAKIIWDTKGTCTPTAGNQPAVSFFDEFNIERTVYFSRPQSIEISVEVTYSVYSEEDLTLDVNNVIKNAVRDYVNNLGLGVDVIPTRIIPAIYSKTQGLNVQSVKLKLKIDPPPYGTTPIAITGSQVALVEFPSDVTVVQV